MMLGYVKMDFESLEMIVAFDPQAYYACPQSVFNKRINYQTANHQDKDVCVGPLIKYTVFDAFFGALCGILLILGSLQKSLVNLLQLSQYEEFSV